MTKPNFRIDRLVAIEHPIYGGICGSRREPTERVYQTAALAHRIAGRLAQADFDACGDDSFQVVDLATGRAHYLPLEATFADDEEVPF
jgi:hypothetical protein